MLPQALFVDGPDLFQQNHRILAQTHAAAGDIDMCRQPGFPCLAGDGRRNNCWGMPVSGIILNERKVENEDKIVKQFAKEEGHTVIQKIRRSDAVQRAEDLGQTVIEALPDADIAEDYQECARKIMEICEGIELEKCV